MGKVMRLVEAIERLQEFDSNDTIYASEPWTETSDAVIKSELTDGKLSPESENSGMKYFLEISIAREFLEDWFSTLEEEPDSSTVCRRLIRYAVDDS